MAGGKKEARDDGQVATSESVLPKREFTEEEREKIRLQRRVKRKKEKERKRKEKEDEKRRQMYMPKSSE